MERQDNLGQLILTLSNTIIKNRNHHLEDLNLTAAQADSLKFFLTHEQATIKDLKEHLDITHQTAQGLVARLAEKGLVTLRRSSSDKRCQRVSVTEAGHLLGDRITGNRRRTGRLLLHGMSEEETEIFIRLLRRAYENVKDDGKGME